MSLTKLFSAGLCLCLLLPAVAMAVCLEESPPGLRNYDGTIGDKYRIRMSLALNRKEVNGLYFYVKQLKDIKLSGHIQDGKRIVLDEIDATGKVTARFEGEFASHDPRNQFAGDQLGCEVIVGTWRQQNAATALPLYLSSESISGGSLAHRYEVAGADDDEAVNRQAVKFWTAVKQGDKESVAALISYPIKVTLAGKKQRIGSAKELLANYDRIFHAEFQRAIVNAVPRHMFARDQGIMLGGGEVWFGPDGKVIALNN